MKKVLIGSDEMEKRTPLEICRLAIDRALRVTGSTRRVAGFREILTFGEAPIYELQIVDQGENKK